jgi:pimeloyl-ACP methyl ester carboxylesterase
MRAGFLQVCGGRVETGWWGPGPDEAVTLVLLHEGLGSVALWRDVPARLAEATGWGVFAYSRFGYGHSDGVTLPRAMTYMQDEARLVLPEVLRAAGIRRAVLVGHSDGGSIAAVYAGSFASKVAGGRAKPGRDTGGGCLLGLVTIAAHFVVEDLNIASIRGIKEEYEAGGLRQRLARYHRDADVAFRGWNDAWLDPRFQDFDITGFLPHIRVPVLALQGAADPYGSDVQLPILEANVRVPITIREIPGARHSPHLEAADVTLAAISDFVAGVLP